MYKPPELLLFICGEFTPKSQLLNMTPLVKNGNENISVP